MRKSQSKRMEDLAEIVAWKGDIPSLSDLLVKVIPHMPEKVGQALTEFYLENKDVPKRGNNGYNIYYYQNLSIGRSILSTLRSASPQVFAEVQAAIDCGNW